VDNLKEAIWYWICSLFPIFLKKCLFKMLFFSLKVQLVDFTVFFNIGVLKYFLDCWFLLVK